MLRKKAGMTQQQFAEKLNLKQTTIGRYEKNAIKPSILILMEISRIYKIDINWLLTGNSNIKSESTKMEGLEEFIKAARENMPAAERITMVSKFRSATASVARRNKLVQNINELRQIAQDLLDRIILLEEEIKR
ncbi:MAG: hypothetical protein DRH89_01215 [Candidatus Cloacimonadota bacterium]|nr:MAG: hypothetical protein DRH89_01215 [Candidatus Cloacimonadota bacterium]